MPNLKRLDIRNGHGIEGLKILGKFYSLQTVVLEDNKFERLEFGDLHLKHLNNLTVTNNLLTSLDNLKKVVLPTLQMLDFRKNSLTSFDFNNLNFAELQEIHLESNKIASVSNISLATLPKLRQLHLEGNEELTDIDLGDGSLPML